MHCRRHGSKSTLAFWSLVLVANIALVREGVDVSVVLLLLAVAVGLVIARRVTDGAQPATQVMTRRGA